VIAATESAPGAGSPDFGVADATPLDAAAVVAPDVAAVVGATDGDSGITGAEVGSLRPVIAKPAKPAASAVK